MGSHQYRHTQSPQKKGHGAHFVCPISNLAGHLAAILFVDDTDIVHLDLNKNEGVEEAHVSLQESVMNWGKLLMATGGAFKPAKCFFHLISFGWRRDGRWHYEENEKKAELEIKIPLPDGEEVAIEHLSVDTPKETLGVFTCPSGNAKGKIASENNKAQEWIDMAKEGHLSRRDVWFLQDHQLWPKLGYSLGSLSAPWRELDGCLRQK